MAENKAIGRIAVSRPFEVVERRAAPRVEVVVPVKLHASSAADAVHGQSMNMSRSGIFIATDHPPPVGTELDLEITLPDRRLLLHAKGKVMRHGDVAGRAGVGVAFTAISYEAQELIDELTKQGSMPNR